MQVWLILSYNIFEANGGSANTHLYTQAQQIEFLFDFIVAWFWVEVAAYNTLFIFFFSPTRPGTVPDIHKAGTKPHII